MKECPIDGCLIIVAECSCVFVSVAQTSSLQSLPRQCLAFLRRGVRRIGSEWISLKILVNSVSHTTVAVKIEGSGKRSVQYPSGFSLVAGVFLGYSLQQSHARLMVLVCLCFACKCVYIPARSKCGIYRHPQTAVVPLLRRICFPFAQRVQQDGC